jgi:hypothetical protein
MARIVYYSETVTGTTNTEVLGNGITSTEAEPKTIKEIIITVSARQGNRVRGYVERERMIDIIDQVCQTRTDAFRLPLTLDLELPVGHTFKVGIACGGTATNVDVVYKCEIAK